MEVAVAKGQQRSNREAKKPKKPAAERSKTDMASTFSRAPGMAKAPSKKK
jgi:hypothetical protein